MRRYLPELVALPMLPFLIKQVRHTRKATLRLPEAGGPVEGIAGGAYGGGPLRMGATARRCRSASLHRDLFKRKPSVTACFKR